MGRFTGILGLLTMLALAYIFSTNRRAIRIKTVAWGLGLQIAFAIFVLRVDYGRRIFQVAGDAANRVLSYAFVGSEFVFGPLGKQGSSVGFIFAFQVLPTVIFICALFAILYHYGIMQFIIRIAAWAMTRIMGASGAESLNVAASIFMGQTEAPVTIRPFLPELTRSELMTVMTSGMAHVSGSIMAAYFAFGAEPRHVLSAVIMTAPGTILVSKMLVPETEVPKTAGRVVMSEQGKPARRYCSRHRRRFAHGSEHRRHADRISRAGRSARWHFRRHTPPHRVVPREPRERSWRGVLTGGVGNRNSLARLSCDRQPSRHAHGAQ
jgi:concentrative nucleoside transporter, CNT family